MRLKFNIFDGMILLMMLPPTMSALTNDTLWDAISKTGELFFLWVLPYFAGRMVLIDAEARRAAFKVLCICAIIIGFIALIEFRLRPYMYARAMQQIGLSDSPTATLSSVSGSCERNRRWPLD
jgi:hypothetical protein